MYLIYDKKNISSMFNISNLLECLDDAVRKCMSGKYMVASSIPV